jgi:hypothetical protein
LLDLALPAGLGVLALGLDWGLVAQKVWPFVTGLVGWLNAEVWPSVTELVVWVYGGVWPFVTEWVGWLRAFGLPLDEGTAYVGIAFGLPAVLCWTFAGRPVRLALGVGAILLTSGLCEADRDKVLDQRRSFFGVTRVTAGWWSDGSRRHPLRCLYHGTTLHGMQFTDGELRYQPMTYFHRTGPIGHLFEAYDPDGRRNLGVLGLGGGTLAAYARKGQHLTFYEIDPVVRAFSFDGRSYFTYVEDARQRGAHIDLVMGDARLTMARRRLPKREKYGILVMDAFSSDSVPVHLLTREALCDVYLPLLSEDGLLVFNVSNRYLDLRPVLANLARDAGLAGLYQLDFDDSPPGKNVSAWVVLARKEAYLERLAHPDRTARLARALGLPAVTDTSRPAWQRLVPDPWVGVWTDDYAPLLRVFTWKGGGPFAADYQPNVTWHQDDGANPGRAEPGHSVARAAPQASP